VKKPIVYNTIQLYRADRLSFLKSSFEKIKTDGAIYAVKLVRGAYMEKERKRAIQKKYSSPIQRDKERCDNDYDAAVEFCLENIQHISFCVASHNEFSNQLCSEHCTGEGITTIAPAFTFLSICMA